MPNEIITKNNINIAPVVEELTAYVKTQSVGKDLSEVFAKLPQTDSPDWKLISGVLCNSIVEWASNKSNVTIISQSWMEWMDEFTTEENKNLSTFDGIFYDTYGDDDMFYFSSSLSELVKSGTKVTWWNNETSETNYYNIPNVTYQAFNVNPPENTYFNSTTYYLPMKEF